MKLRLLLAALCAVLFVSNADARPRHHSLQKTQRTNLQENFAGCSDPVMRPCQGVEKRTLQQKRIFRAKSKHPSPGLRRVMAEGAGRVVNWIRPRAWCGWFMRREFGVANPAGNLARWWAGFGRPAHGPAVGAIVVWRHHVGRITGRTADGRWIVKSGNDGHRVRERPRSVAAAIAFRWPA
jgi:hypothetical protein